MKINDLNIDSFRDDKMYFGYYEAGVTLEYAFVFGNLLEKGKVCGKVLSASSNLTFNKSLDYTFYFTYLVEVKPVVVMDAMWYGEGATFEFSDPFTITCNGKVIFKLNDEYMIARITARIMTDKIQIA